MLEAVTAAAAVNDSIGSLLGGVDMKDMKEVKGTESNPWNFFVRGNVILAQGFSQTDVGHFDDNTESVVLGTDYRFTTNKGYFSDQLLVHNHQYGFDPVLEYIDIYVPHVAHGMNIRAGRRARR